MATVDFVTGFGGGGSLTGEISFEDYSAVEDISAQREVEVFGVVFLEMEGFHRGEFVDCCKDCGI